MERVLEALHVPGRRHEVRCSAPARTVIAPNPDDPERLEDNIRNFTNCVAAAKPKLLDRWLDKVVETSGSPTVYFAILALLFTWAFLGIKFGKSDTYMIVISDAQAIVNMVFDAFLMRQQLNSYDSYLTVAACLQSRALGHERMLRQVVEKGGSSEVLHVRNEEPNRKEFEPELPKDNWLGRVSTALAIILGHIIAVVGFCLCVVIWLAFGHYCHWSSTWQLYMNSATSALMIFMMAFIANIRETHNKYMMKCLSAVSEVDLELESRLRRLTEDQFEHPVVVIPALKQSKFQRVIDYYADLVGTLTGIVILICILVVWIAIGPALHFDSNWWLLIGTYAGLVGLNDGFVLRNVSTALDDYANEQFDMVKQHDLELLMVIGAGRLEQEEAQEISLSRYWSIRVGNICAHERMVASGLVLIVGLVIGASAMHWSLTGQLLCNVPPSIIESFFTIMLLTGHNMGEERRRAHFWEFYLRRLELVSFLNTLPKM